MGYKATKIIVISFLNYCIFLYKGKCRRTNETLSQKPNKGGKKSKTEERTM